MVQRRDQSNPGDDLMSGRDESHGCPKSCRNDAHVLDGTVGKETLHFHLDCRIENPNQGGDAAHYEHDQAGARLLEGRKIHVEANNPVNPEIDDHCGQ